MPLPPNPQVFIFEDGGKDLEHATLDSASDIQSILLQVSALDWAEVPEMLRMKASMKAIHRVAASG